MPEQNLANMTAAPVVIKGSDGEDYTLTPISLGDMGRLERWLREVILEDARDLIQKFEDFLDPGQKTRIKEEAITKAMAIHSLLSEEAQEMMNSMRAVLQSTWLSIRHEHKEVTVEQAGDLFGAFNIQELMDKMDRASGLADIGGKSKTSEAS